MTGTLTFLGSGTSTGVPMIGCGCGVCRSADPKDQRTRSSAWIQSAGLSALIDSSTDLRAQALRVGMRALDAVFYTHHHADHVHGIDDLRSFSLFAGKKLPCYGPAPSLERIREMFAYIFNGKDAPGGGKPLLELVAIEGPVTVNGLTVTPIPARHGDALVFGYRMGRLAYLTDCSSIPPASIRHLEGVETLILGAMKAPRHATHFTLEQALETITLIKPRRAYLTHLNHAVSHAAVSAALPEGVALAWDGLTVEF
ncbi:MAG: MBL fold metallo-hydrolase [Nitrospinae bacterium]|nr:MBL fold metallo-hydrolase [Nitrospinota bacterium]